MNPITQSYSENNRPPGNGVSGSGGGTRTHLHYTCLPSSTALSPNAHVTIAIRSFHTNIQPASFKQSSSPSLSSSSPSSTSGKNGNADFGTQLYVSAQVLGIGSLPLHSNTVDSTASSILRPISKLSNHEEGNTNANTNANNSTTTSTNHRNKADAHLRLPTMSIDNQSYNQISYNHYSCTWDDDKHNNANIKSNLHQHQQQHQSNHHHQHHYHQNNILTLPIRYRDLSHDACIKLQIHTSRNVIIGTVLLSLWDDKQRLKMGLHKLNVDLLSKSKLVANPSIGNEEEKNEKSSDNDEKWEACLILDKLQQIETMTKSKRKMSISSYFGSNDTVSMKQQQQQQEQQEKHHGHYPMEDLNITVNGLRNCNSIQSVPWLDSFTKQHCMDILNDTNEDDDGEDVNDDIVLAGATSTNYSHIGNSNTYSSALNPSDGNAYLVVELQQCDVPIVYHEQSYGTGFVQNGPNNANTVNPSGSSGGNNVMPTNAICSSASGSITALDLTLYHHQCMKHQQNNKMNKGDTGDDKSNSDTSSMFIDPNAIQMPDLVQAFNESQEMGMKLVQVLDFESVHDNPVEEKYRTLQHELLRGLVDPALKPDASERSHLNAIIGGTSQHLTREEKDLLWRFRFSLVDNRRALTKFLLAVEWTVESEVVQAAELLEQWRKRSPIEVSDALKLLGKNVAFQTGLVRAYAIDTLALADDGELVLYLLQLVQALKYETTTDEETGLNSLKQFRGAMDTKKGPKNNSSLAAFLIERASKNIQLANYLYWYLKVQLEDPIYGQRYKEVFLALKNRLSRIPFKIESDKRSLHHGQSKFTPLSGVLDSVSKIGAGNSKKATTIYRTMWNVLETQDNFISDVVECQLESREARGKKDAKEMHLRDSLKKKGCHAINNGVAVPLPSAPQIWVTGVKSDSARMFKSALYPALLEFYIDQQSSNNDSKADGATYKVMVKTGDDLRQDQLVIMMIKLMDRILKRGTLDLFLKPYPILAMSDRTGLVEFVPDSMAISQILAENNNSMMEYFQKVAPSSGHKYGIDPDVMQTYIRSCAGYCVITYLIGVGDRHLDNIMLQRSGHFFHIDFGFIFGRDPKPLPPAFRLTKEMVDGMGGQDSQEYRQFCSLACQAYNLLRKRSGLILNLLHLMSDAGIEDLSNHPYADAEGVIAEVEKRFKLDLTDEQAETYFVQLIKESVSAFAPRVMDVFHQMAVARR